MAKDSTFVLRRTNDYFFKYVFGSEEGSDVLIDFLNATQNRPPNNRIKTVKLEDREIDPERYMDKAIRLDVVATPCGRKQSSLILLRHHQKNKRSISIKTSMHLLVHSEDI